MVGSSQRDSKKDNTTQASRKRTRIDLEMKMKLITIYEERGLGMSTIARDFGLSVSTVNSIVKDADRIKKHVQKSALLKSTVITKWRAVAIDEMERLLIAWIEGKMKSQTPLKLTTIQAKARLLYEKVKKEKCPDAPQTFVASNGWFNRFKTRAGFSFKNSGGYVLGDSKTNEMSSSLSEENANKHPFTTILNRLMAAQLAQSCPTKTETTTRPKPATETLSSANSLIRNDSLSHPTPAKLQKKTERQFGNQFFEEKRQMAAAAQSAQVVAPQMQVPSQMQVQQHLQVSVPPPAPVQVAPRQVQVLAPPVQVTVAKPKPVEKPRPREKRIFVVADHQRCVMSNLASLWKSGKLCDAGIGNGSSTVMVHKVVLSAVCPKLLSVFSTDILSHKFLQVNFPEEVSTEALNAFAEYMYNGILDLDRDILEQLKIIAKRLDMKEFEQLCDSHLPNHMHQPASAAVASFSNVPLIQTTMPIPPMTSSLPSLGSTISTSMHSAPSITTQVIDVKQEISEAELDQVKKDTAAVFGQESVVSSLAPNKSGNAAGFVISPSIKTEPVGPEDDKYGHLGSSNQAFTSTASSSSVVPTAASTSIASVPASSTEFAIPFSEATDVKSTRLTVTHSYDPPLVSDLSPVSRIVETVCSQSSPMNVDSSKPLSWLSSFATSTEGSTTSTGNEGVYPVGLFTAGGDNLPLLTTETVDVKNIDLYKTDLT